MEEEPEHPEKEPQQACSVYRPNRYRLGLVFLRRQRLSVCCRRSKPLTNKLPYDSGGVYCITGSPSLPQQSASWRGRQSTSVNYNNTRRRSSRPRSANPIFHISSPLSHPCLQKARYYMSLRSLNSIVVKQSHIFYINYINNIHCKQKILHKIAVSCQWRTRLPIHHMAEHVLKQCRDILQFKHSFKKVKCGSIYTPTETPTLKI